MFAGKPMLQWNLEKCLSVFDRVYVSSDSDKILAFAYGLGAIPIKRDKELCGDTPDIPVFRHAAEHIPDLLGVVAVHVDTPLTDISIIRRTKLLIENGINEVMTCRPIVRTKDYHKQFHRIYGSVRGLSLFKLMDYGDAYKPTPDVLLVDNSIEIETPETYHKALCSIRRLS